MPAAAPDAPIDLRLFPRSAVVDADGHLRIGGCDVDALAPTFGTPLYVYDEHELRTRAREYRDAFGADAVSYAGKAFLCMAMARLVADEGLHLDVATGGELHVAVRAGFPPRASCSTATTSPTPSCAPRSSWASVASSPTRSTSSTASRRWSPRAGRRRGCWCGSRPASRRTPTSTSRPAPTTRSSASPSPTARRARPRCAWRSPTRSTSPASTATSGRRSWCSSRSRSPPRSWRTWPPRWPATRPPPSTRSTSAVGSASPTPPTTSTRRRSPSSPAWCAPPTRPRVATPASIPRRRLTVEAGRSIAGPSGITLYTVGTIKEIPGVRTYVAVDGGMSDNPRPATYGAAYEACIPARVAEAPARSSPPWRASTASRAICSSATRTCRPTSRSATCS